MLYMHINKNLVSSIDDLDELLKKRLENLECKDFEILDDDYQKLQKLDNSIRKIDMTKKEFRDNLECVRKFLKQNPLFAFEMKLFESEKRAIVKKNIPDIGLIYLECKKEKEKALNSLEQKQYNEALFKKLIFLINDSNISLEVFEEVIRFLFDKSKLSQIESMFLFRYFSRLNCVNRGLSVIMPMFINFDTFKHKGESVFDYVFINKECLKVDFSKYQTGLLRLKTLLHELQHYEQFYARSIGVESEPSINYDIENLVFNKIVRKRNFNYNFSEIECDANYVAFEKIDSISSKYLDSKFHQNIHNSMMLTEIKYLMPVIEEEGKIKPAYPRIIEELDKIAKKKYVGHIAIKLLYDKNGNPMSIGELLKNNSNYEKYITVFTKFLFGRMDLGEKITCVGDEFDTLYKLLNICNNLYIKLMNACDKMEIIDFPDTKIDYENIFNLCFNYYIDHFKQIYEFIKNDLNFESIELVSMIENLEQKAEKRK